MVLIDIFIVLRADFLFAKQEGRSLKLFCMPCRARGVGRLVGATPTLGPAAVHSAALHSTAEYGNTRLSLMPGGVRRKSHGVSKLHAVDTHSRVREPVTLHLPALFHNRLEDDVPMYVVLGCGLI